MVKKVLRRMAGVSVAIVLTACGLEASPPSRTAEAEIESTAPPAPAEPAPISTCVMPDEMPACAWPAVDQAALDARAKQLLKRVKDSAWKDHASLVELTRVQLLASGGRKMGVEVDVNGPRLNAQRALAVDPSDSARLVAALALLHTHLPRAKSSVARELLFLLVGNTLQPDGRPPSPARRQGQALVEYHRIITSGKTRSPADSEDETPLGRFGVQLRRDWEAGRRSGARLPTYAPLARAASASDIPKGGAASFALASGPLAPESAPPTPCDATATSTAEGQAFCTAGEALRANRSAAAANDVVAAYRNLRPACEDGDPVCGAHVSQTLLSAAEAFRDDGRPGKSIAILRIVQSSFSARAPDVTLRLADGYFALGMYSHAAKFIVLHARGQGWKASSALRRALVIELALGRPGHQIEWLREAMRVRATPAEERRAWAALAAPTIPVDAREAWRRSLSKAIRPATHAESEPSAPTCDPTLLCGYVAVLNDDSWSSAD